MLAFSWTAPALWQSAVPTVGITLGTAGDVGVGVTIALLVSAFFVLAGIRPDSQRRARLATTRPALQH